MKLDNMFKKTRRPSGKKGHIGGKHQSPKFRRDFCVNVTNVRKQLLQRTL